MFAYFIYLVVRSGVILHSALSNINQSRASIIFFFFQTHFIRINTNERVLAVTLKIKRMKHKQIKNKFEKNRNSEESVCFGRHSLSLHGNNTYFMSTDTLNKAFSQIKIIYQNSN